MYQNNILLFLTSTYQNNPKTPIKHQIITFSKNNNLKSTLRSKNYCKKILIKDIKTITNLFFSIKKGPFTYSTLKKNLTLKFFSNMKLNLNEVNSKYNFNVLF